ncbi:threonine-phosphate decarboxylase [Paracoccus aestuarii]|uniref:threonine-phosphate decarboxylase n=1 Tax=Paracoccus aestuarii TaxID=453842 RepID=A0A418ZTP8_9RHOB|nr:threonine-phosphate decarboxylase CobD [Paracoccus aestuarii]RJL01513.1 threonine-phosphate decarboxylase [Paracoccus aestuarii]WCQ99910.1 threonine-phosphate decarboxylase [Paracoccus aestuarii]
MARDHGGDLDRAEAAYGPGDWIDLSTGINRRPWPVAALPDRIWRALPTARAESALIAVAADWFGCPPDRVLPMAGASAAIQILPRLGAPGNAAVLTPSYNEHAASLTEAGWRVTPAPDPDAMEGADLAVIVNPNNPDGREWHPDRLRALASQVGMLVVDESFADPRPDLSLAGAIPDNAVILRSFGKFWGLAGLRLGFALAHPPRLEAMRRAAGPWAVSGPALHVGRLAMADRAWADDAVMWHAEAAPLLDRIAHGAGWDAVGGTHLFRLYQTGDAAAAQDRLARGHVWSRRFPYSPGWLRLGIPGSRAEFDRLRAILGG